MGELLDDELKAWLYKPLTSEQYANWALDLAQMKKTKRPFLIPHIAHVIEMAIENDREWRKLQCKK